MEPQKLIDLNTVLEEIDDTVTSVSFCGTVEAARSAHETKYRILSRVKDLPTVDAVPIKAISAWLAGYADPPKYAMDHFPESGHCLANTMAAAWEHHIRTMIECGLMQEEQDGTDNS